jgi:hypothetical protein
VGFGVRGEGVGFEVQELELRSLRFGSESYGFWG